MLQCEAIIAAVRQEPGMAQEVIYGACECPKCDGCVFTAAWRPEPGWLDDDGFEPLLCRFCQIRRFCPDA